MRGELLSVPVTRSRSAGRAMRRDRSLRDAIFARKGRNRASADRANVDGYMGLASPNYCKGPTTLRGGPAPTLLDIPHTEPDIRGDYGRDLCRSPSKVGLGGSGIGGG